MARMSKEEKEQIRKERSEIARKHVQATENEFATEIRHSIGHSKIYSPDSFDTVVFPTPKNAATEMIVCGLDSVSAAYEYSKAGKKKAILNFADFTRIGGKFLEGAAAQEEALCHESVLYSVQKAFKESYYGKNIAIKAEMSASENEFPDLYRNRALYSEDVIFIHNDVVKTFDVISCAAPNFYRGQRYHKIDPERNDTALQNRIHFVLQIARDNNVDILMLGAFGCGVFSQDPYRTASIFKEFLSTEFAGVFETVVFPIPAGKRSNRNFEKFHEVFNGTE